MEVMMMNWRRNLPGRRVDLASVLAPKGDCQAEGRIESLAEQVTACSEAIGRLLEKLVEKERLTLEEAKEISGLTAELELLSSKDDVT
jgi:hypothetical protein